MAAPAIIGLLAKVGKGVTAAKGYIAKNFPAVSSGGSGGSTSAASQPDLSGEIAAQQKTSIDSMIAQNMKMLQVDNKFYGHNKVEGHKQDKSGFYDHQKEVGQTLF